MNRNHRMSVVSNKSDKFNLLAALNMFENDIKKKDLSSWGISFDELVRICKKKNNEKGLLNKILRDHVVVNLVSIILDS